MEVRVRIKFIKNCAMRSSHHLDFAIEFLSFLYRVNLIESLVESGLCEKDQIVVDSYAMSKVQVRRPMKKTLDDFEEGFFLVVSIARYASMDQGFDVSRRLLLAYQLERVT